MLSVCLSIQPPSYSGTHLQMFRSVEVVKEAQENFAASSGVTPLPPLPVRPRTRPEAKRTGRPGRVPRRILAADRIFTPDVSDVSNISPSMMQSECASPVEITHNVSTVLTIPSDESSAAPITPPAVSSPRQRRVTISSVSPNNSANMMIDVETSPLRHEKAKSASHLNRLVRPITPLDMLEKELEKGTFNSLYYISFLLTLYSRSCA